MKLLVINGPNLNLLGLREPAIYGSQNYESLLALIRAACDAEGIEVGFAQSNHEGAIVDAIQAAYGVYDRSRASSGIFLARKRCSSSAASAWGSSSCPISLWMALICSFR